MRRAILAACAAMAGLAATARAEVPAAVTDDAYGAVRPDEAKLGRLLFWDPILSGNRNISCGTCHHPRFGTGDGVSLSLGEGGVGLGPQRVADPANMPEQRVPRNAPGLFNLGAHEFTVMFHDGRIEADPTHKNGFRTPLEDDMTEGFDSILSAQTMFPVLSPDEMAGHYSENEVSRAVRQGIITGPGGAWDLISKRVEAIPEYRTMFAAVYPEVAAGREIRFTDISNAIAAFIAFEWRSDDSPFDKALRGQGTLTPEAQAGMALFYGEAGCSTCHSGPFQTDQSFHAMGVPQLGPGKGARFETHKRDEGRWRVTGHPADLYKFRTPSLRNVTATAPYGHDGAYATLQGFLAAHAAPRAALTDYERTQVILAGLPGVDDWVVMSTPDQVDAIRAAIEVPDHPLENAEIAALVAFLDSLTDPAAIAGRLGIPETVPSGLPVDR